MLLGALWAQPLLLPRGRRLLQLPFRPGGHSPLASSDAADGLPGVREAFRDLGFSEETQDILLSSWRVGTRRSYRTYLRRWFEFCHRKRRSLSRPTEQVVVAFLTHLFHEGLQLSSLRVAKAQFCPLMLRVVYTSPIPLAVY